MITTLLQYVSGLSLQIAKNIIVHIEKKNGAIKHNKDTRLSVWVQTFEQSIDFKNSRLFSFIDNTSDSS